MTGIGASGFICELAPPVMKWDIIGRPTIVETGNAPNPLGRDRIGVTIRRCGCSGGGYAARLGGHPNSARFSLVSSWNLKSKEEF
jgi:hypothetical protein